MTTERTCSKCGNTKPLVEFYSRGHCKACVKQNVRQWKLEHPQHVSEQRRRWFAKHSDLARAQRTRAKHVRREAGQREPARFFDPLVVYERDQWICWLCGQPVLRSVPRGHRAAASVDCVVPISRGGRYELSNVRLAHHWCNSKRGARMVVARGDMSDDRDAIATGS